MALDFTSESNPDRSRRWTVLLGENGCGKTSILKAIGLVLAGSEALPDLLGETDQWIRNGCSYAKITAIICNANGERRDVSLELHRGEGRDQVIKRNAVGLADLDAALLHADRNYFVAGYGAFRRPPGAKEHEPSRRHGRSSHLATLFSPSTDLISLEQWAIQLDYVSGDEGRKIISTALQNLLPGMAFSGIDKRTRQVMMTTIDGEIPLRQLSEGYQAMAAWAGDLLFRMTETFQDRARPFDARGLLLIDEMDLHLHPIWKRRLVDFINNAFPNMQVIATTHSPLSVQQCSEGELFVVRRESGVPMLFGFKGDPSKMRLSELFLSPLIGLETLDSPKVERLRSEAREIELKVSQPTPQEMRRLQSISAELEGVSAITMHEAPGFGSFAADAGKVVSSPTAHRLSNAVELFGKNFTFESLQKSMARAKKAASGSTASDRAPRKSTLGNAKKAVKTAAAPKRAVAAKTLAKPKKPTGSVVKTAKKTKVKPKKKLLAGVKAAPKKSLKKAPKKAAKTQTTARPSSR